MRTILLAALLLTVQACSGSSETTPTSSTGSPVATTTTTAATTTTSQPPSDSSTQYGVQFTELLTLDRIGRGDGAPVAILVHGGGWYGGDRSSLEPLALELADRGFVVVNATYRTDSGGFPESVEDVVCALISGREIAAQAGGTGPVILVGHSAGAHLASLATLAGNEFAPSDCRYEGPAVPPDGFVGLAGPYKIQNLFGLLDDWMGTPVTNDPDLWSRAVPETYVDRNVDVPIRLVHGDADRVANISFSRLFAEELEGVDGRDVELIEIPGGGHSTMLSPLPDAPVAIGAIEELVELASARSIDVETSVDGDTVTIDVEADGFLITFQRGDTSGATGHIHAYVDREPPEAGELVPLGVEQIIHSGTDRLVIGGLSAGDHVIWVVVADGADRAMVPPEPVRVEVTIDP